MIIDSKVNASKFIIISYLSYKLHCCTLPDKRCLSHGMRLFQVMMTLQFLNDVANTNRNFLIIASLKSEAMGKLINRIPGVRLLISSLPG